MQLPAVREKLFRLSRLHKILSLIFLLIILVLFTEGFYYLCLEEDVLGCGLFVENFLPGLQKNEIYKIRKNAAEISRIVEGELVSVSKEGLVLKSEGEEVYLGLDEIIFVSLLETESTDVIVSGVFKEISQLKPGQIIGVGLRL